MIESLGLLVVVVTIAAVGGLLLGRLIARRIDRWQEPAEEKPIDDSDPA